LWLYDEKIQLQTMNWLTLQKTDAVTPQKLQQALNDTIFLDLNIAIKNPISEQTACQWLIKLGWWWTAVRKGVYMDGHECVDVVEYWNKVFLPAIANFERWMAQHAGPELKKLCQSPSKANTTLLLFNIMMSLIFTQMMTQKIFGCGLVSSLFGKKAEAGWFTHQISLMKRMVGLCSQMQMAR
jgi:hypothetical protein